MTDDKPIQKVTETTPPTTTIDEIHSELPPELVSKTSELFAMMQGQMIPPYMHKIESEHIKMAIEAADKSDERAFKDMQAERRYTLYYILAIIALIIALTFMIAKENPSTYEKIIMMLIGLVAGAFGGYGYGKTKADD